MVFGSQKGVKVGEIRMGISSGRKPPNFGFRRLARLTGAQTIPASVYFVKPALVLPNCLMAVFVTVVRAVITGRVTPSVKAGLRPKREGGAARACVFLAAESWSGARAEKLVQVGYLPTKEGRPVLRVAAQTGANKSGVEMRGSGFRVGCGFVAFCGIGVGLSGRFVHTSCSVLAGRDAGGFGEAAVCRKGPN